MEILLTFLKTFIVGGLICVIAQLLINYTKITAGRILVYFLLSGVFLGAIGVYKYLVDFAGSGATVPISGFGYLLAEGAKKGAKESLFKAITGGITSAGMGLTAAIVFGYIFAM
ncbi:MAG: SpoVA/SpoVAEb family sporulation membrane protein, partial [Firmicutes bacterium]|nr:SpoVA/SpoVAEb family sporulation membrane protein [Candidatus Caballimonas caccae]